ncbi:MAG: cysteine hydrolase [Clostridiales bacterium]|nr:cysteine hydrolase [Clostridiales bacterium]
MKLGNSQELVNASTLHMLSVYNGLESTEVLNVENLSKSDTVLVVVDMVNGFVKRGNLASSRIKSIVDPIRKVKDKCDALGIRVLAFADCHTENSEELRMFPKHCMKGTEEEEIISELDISNVIKKNSTNGFLEEEFLKWLSDNENVCNFIVVGCCTDICVKDFAITLKLWFNKNNKKSRVIVPVDAVETYDAPWHDAFVKNVIALDMMIDSGIEVVKNIV